MSLPVSDEEWLRASLTMACAGSSENLVSTACPECGTRFAVLGRLTEDGWALRCTVCRAHFAGELKT